MTEDSPGLKQAARRAWEANAAYWDEQTGEGNIYQLELIGPATERLLELHADESVLDVACGNGAFARRMAELGARVVGIDWSETMIDRARRRTASERVEYAVVDATDEAGLRTLGESRFDAVVCTMSLMDMTAVEPLARAVPRLLKPVGRFVFSVLHPCFNTTSTQRLLEDRYGAEGRLERVRGIKLTRYLTGGAIRGEFIAGQPEPHVYFERPLSVLLAPFFAAGLALDALEEPAFAPPPPETSGPLSWQRMHEFPPILVARLRPV